VTAAATGDEGALALLGRPGFAKLLAYRIFAMLSYQVVAVTVGWHIYEVTRNPFSLGLVGLAWSAWPRCCRSSAWHRLPATWSTTCRVAGWAWSPARAWSPPRWC